MTQEQLSQLGKTLWAIADDLRGAMDADDFRNYMLSFLFLRYLSDNYQTAADSHFRAGAGTPAGTAVWRALSQALERRGAHQTSKALSRDREPL